MKPKPGSEYPPNSHNHTYTAASTTTPLENKTSALGSSAAVTTSTNYHTPPLRPIPSPSLSAIANSSNSINKTTAMADTATGATTVMSTKTPNSTARRKISALSDVEDDVDDYYAQFVQGLGVTSDDPLYMASALTSLASQEELDEEFLLTDLEEDDDDDEYDIDMMLLNDSSMNHDNYVSSVNDLPPSLDHDFYSELEAELGSLLEEDLEAAVSTLLAGNSKAKPTPSATIVHATCNVSGKGKPPTTPNSKTSADAGASPQTPLGEATRSNTVSNVLVSQEQLEQYRDLLRGHYQLLLQNCVLAIRAARRAEMEDSPERFFCGETPEDLTEILDACVGMLQDLDQNRKDAIRNYILKLENDKDEKRLTRLAFSTLAESTNAQTVFNIAGIAHLKGTFRAMDHVGKGGPEDVLSHKQHGEACRMLLEHAGADYQEKYLPGKCDYSELLCDATEVFGSKFEPPTSIPHQIMLRKNRNQFTASEDNLVLRGVNLYGEKQWMLIADRYLPDRSINIISQRYSKICLMLYKAHGVKIDDRGNLETPPRFEKIDQLDDEAIAKIKKASPPAIHNVHRWSLEEDVTLLKAVPLIGPMWAELSTRLIPHRDRGHLRKRYQVLERRVKATVTRNQRRDIPPATARASSVAPSAVPNGLPVIKPPRQPKPIKAPPPRSPIRPPAAAAAAAAAKAGASPAALRGPRHPKSLSPPKKLAGSPQIRPGAPQPAAAAASRASAKMFLPLHGTSNGGTVLPQPETSSSPSASRFEKIIRETSEDWSQLSRMKKMIENDTESMVASAIVHNLAAGRVDPMPSRHEALKTVELLPQIEIDSKSSSGFSMLNITRDAADVNKDPATPAKKQKCSIMASVMELTRKPASSPKENAASSENAHGDKSMSAPLTPGQPPSARQFGPFGTPLDAPSPGPHLRHVFSPETKIGQSPNVKSCFSPAAMNSLMFDSSVVDTNDYELYPTLELTDASRQALEQKNGGTPSKHFPFSAHLHTPSNANVDLFGHLKATDLEAISALNSLSNSPAKYLDKRKASDDIDDGNGRSNSGTSKSLFATVVGGVEKKESRRKKRRTDR